MICQCEQSSVPAGFHNNRKMALNSASTLQWTEVPLVVVCETTSIIKFHNDANGAFVRLVKSLKITHSLQQCGTTMRLTFA